MSYLDEERSYRDRAASTYDSSFSAYQTAEERRTVAMASVRGVTLDHGCGTARFADLLVDRGQRVVGLDLSAVSLAIAASRGERPVQSSVISLPFRSGAFDTVISVQVLEHLIVRTDLDAALREIDRVLAPGGTALLTVYNLHLFDRLRRRHSGDVATHRFVRSTRRGLRRDLQAAFPGSAVATEGQCHFLRRGTRFAQPLERLAADWLPSSLLASFWVARVSKPTGTSTVV